VVVDTSPAFSAHVLAHELAHVLCLGDLYHMYHLVFPQPGLQHGPRNQAAFREARAWAERMSQAVDAEKAAHPNLTDGQARGRVKRRLNEQDQRRWNMIFNLIGPFGTELTCRDCRRMCRCLRDTWQRC
jgi:hypothetical protein